MKRRTFLKAAGVITVAAVGAGVWRAYDQGALSEGEGPAYEPWKNWRMQSTQGPLNLVRAAILAANPHNSQPWLFNVSDSRIDLFAAPDRNLGSLDPYTREMYTG